VVVRHRALVYEHYFGVEPLAWNATAVHVNAPVFSFFPQYADLRAALLLSSRFPSAAPSCPRATGSR
jgi:hypothetical protein